MKIQDICPNCEKITTLEKIQKNESLKIRGELINVSCEFLHCQECEQEFDDPQSQVDTLDLAYREFRRRHHMLQPEEIKALRKNYDLTQKELSGLLSWGEVTLSRYEKGKLQDSAHDAMLHLIQNPMNVLNLIDKNENNFSSDRKKDLIEKLTLLNQQNDLETVYRSSACHNAPSIFNGFQKLDTDKIHTMMLFFCYPEGQFQTKLCKLLYYADTLHYHKHNQSITGLQYAKMPYGPVPNYYDQYKTSLIENNTLEIEEIFFNDNMSGVNLKSINGPNLSIFSKEEQQTLIEIKKLFIKYSSKKISDLSHQEEGYIKTQDRAFISYEYAKNLKILKFIPS